MQNHNRHSMEETLKSTFAHLKEEPGIFLNASTEAVDDFFQKLQRLPSPTKEQVFVLCCLNNALSVELVNQ